MNTREFMANGLFRACVAAAIFVAGCGGGESDADLVEGRVIDGYIRGAKVYWDCNGNNYFDEGEISTSSGVGGKYKIASRPSGQCSLRAYIGVGSIDEDDPGLIVMRPYTLAAVDGQPEIISPFTTLISGRVASGNYASTAEAERSVASILGYSGSIVGDYKASNNSYLANGAKIIVSQVQASVNSGDFYRDLNAVDIGFSNLMDRNGAQEALITSIQPYFFKNSGISHVLSKFNPENIVKRAYGFHVAADNALIDGYGTLLTASHVADYGSINLHKLSDADLKKYYNLLYSSEISVNNEKNF